MLKPPTPAQPPSKPTRGFSRYKRSETSRLVRGAIDAGLTVRGIEIDPDTGVLRVLVDHPDATDDPERRTAAGGAIAASKRARG